MPRVVKLTPKQERFCEEYLIDLNATAAAKRAGFSEKSAMEQGYALINKPHVMAKISELKTKRSERTEINADWVLKQLALIAAVDLGKAYDENGDLLPVQKMPDEVRLALSSVDVHKDFTEGVEIGETKKIKMEPKLRALELIGRHLKLFGDGSLKLTVTWEDLLRESLKDDPK